MRRCFGIRAHLLVLFALAAFLPMLGGHALVSWIVVPRVESRELSLLEAGARHLARHASQVLQGHVDSLEMLAVGGLPSQAALERAHRARPEFCTMLAAHAGGAVAASSPPLQEGALDLARQLLPRREYFRRPLATGLPFISGVFQGAGFGQDLIVAVSVPVPGEPAIVQASLSLESLRGSLQATASEWGVHLLLADAAGRVIAAPAGGNYPVFQSLDETPLSGAAGLVPGPPTLIEVNLRGQPDHYYAVAANLSAGGWRLILFREQSLVHGRVQSLLGPILLLWGALALLAVIPALGSSRWVVDPIKGLHRRVLRLSAIDTDAEPPPPPVIPRCTPREIAELNEAFHSMSLHLRVQYSELHAARAHLERRVRERTSLIERANTLYHEEVLNHRRARQDLELRNRAIAESAEGIVIASAAGGGLALVFVNPGFERITGYAAHEVLGRNPSFLHGPDTCPETRARLRAAVAGGEPCAVEILNYRKSGEPFWCRLSISPIAHGGGITHWVGVKSDITAAKEVDRLKTELVATVSHELRTPLTSIRGFAELLRARPFSPEKQRHYLGIITEEAARLTRLIDDWLDLQRIESGRLGYQFESGALDAVLRTSVEALEGAAAHHRLVSDIPHDLPPVRFDSERIQQVLANLLSNAIKFSPPGATIRISAALAGPAVRVEVADEGIGIPAAAIPHLFTRFFRVDEEASRRAGGAGLGLELVKCIVEDHGGEVGVHSTPGRGSTFFFTLPLAPDPVTASR